MLNDGHTYERAAIESWMARSTRSPLTGESLDPASLKSNLTLRALIAGL